MYLCSWGFAALHPRLYAFTRSASYKSDSPERLVRIVVEGLIRAVEPVGPCGSANVECDRVFERFGRVLNSRPNAQALIRHQRHVAARQMEAPTAFQYQ